MFIKEVSEYDLDNDFQLALFLKDCLDGYIVFKRRHSPKNWNEWHLNKWLQGKGPSYDSMCLSFKIYVDASGEDGYGDWRESELDDLDMFLYKIMVEMPKYLKSLEKKHEEYQEWIRSGGDPRHAGSDEFSFHPYSSNEVKEYSFSTSNIFKKHFSTEENILQTLDHLSRIMKVEKINEKMKKEMKKEMMKKK